ncbi:transglycosylase domain-containing protein [uncultured Jatrophihabitans sp.]|uniref:transglycosylase domain-containing protein n=1 Tax=uncultured Jatrophihabitans sp. TaxID=1610747 RepID=UPI0035CB2972
MASDFDRPSRWPTVGKLLLALLATAVLASGIALPYVLGSGLVAKHYATQFQNTTCNLPETKPPEPTTLYARDGSTVLARVFTQDRIPVSLSQVPKYLQDALIATEDRRFYSHHGVDLRGLVRSAVSTSSGDTQGGSTLTMQYVKQIRYYQAGDNKAKQAAAIAQNARRKMEDARCALDIEGARHESKSQILDNYLNIAFFGEHAYGIEVAAQTYFHEPTNKLTLPQAAMLVGLLRAPSAYDPFVNPAAAKERRNEVLQNLVTDKKLSQAEADRDKAQPIALASQSAPLVKQGCANTDTKIPNSAFFCDYTVNWLTSVGGISQTQLQSGGLKVVTTIDPGLQASMQKRIQKAIPASSPMTSVMPVVDPKTGDVLAMASSKTYGTKAGQTEQPIFTKYTAGGASTFKLFPLLTALQTGMPKSLSLTTEGNTGQYKAQQCQTPTNAQNGDANVHYSQTETLQQAAANSDNTYFVGLADRYFGCHLSPITDIMSQLGMKSMNEPSDVQGQTWTQAVVNKERAQQLVLGSIPTSPLELAGAYAAVADGGKYWAPAPVIGIKDANGSAVTVKRPQSVQVISPQAAATAAQVLTGDTQSGGTSAKVFASAYAGGLNKVAGKTGTNQASNQKQNSSIWFVGMTPDYVAASGLINFDQSSAPSSGLPGEKKGAAYGDYAAKVWLDALQPTLKGKSWTWQSPDSVDGDQVPNIGGKSEAKAKQMLNDKGLTLKILDPLDDLQCASNNTAGTIGYYGPKIAEQGTTVTACLSNGAAPVVARAQPTSTTRNSGNSNSGSSSRRRSGSRHRNTPRSGRSSSSHHGPGHH